MQKHYFLAIDLGASSGRIILGTLANDKIDLLEIHRFANQMIQVEGHFKWDLNSLYREILAGLRKCVDTYQITPHCIGIDTWGVDFGLLDYTGTPAGEPFAYRDSLTDQAIEQVTSKIKPRELYTNTGIQFMQFNTLFQLWGLKKKYPSKLLSADKLMFMPDLLTYFLTGAIYSEYTIASTSQMMDPKTGKWNMKLLHKLGLPTHILQEIVRPGTVIGTLNPALQAEMGIGPVPVAAVAAHDTASAIAAIPAEGTDWAYLSSGTWSLLGVELDEPCLSDEAFLANFTNEGGIEGTIRFLKNINGLWLLQECKKRWDLDHEYSFADLAKSCLKAPPFQSLIDPDHASFLNPDNMIEAIQDYCKQSGQIVPESIPEITRTIFESLALKYKSTLESLIEVTGKEINRIHLIGGGSQNKTLCQFTANATGKEVIAGPTEGTALGNILLQAKSLGILESMEEMRTIIKNTVATQVYKPVKTKKWQEAALSLSNIITQFK